LNVTLVVFTDAAAEQEEIIDYIIDMIDEHDEEHAIM
jgi:hypothetical protein